MILLIISMIFCFAAFAADFLTTRANNNINGITETTKMFRRADGHCDLKKLLIFKIGLFIALTVAVVIVCQLDDGLKLAFLAPLVMGAYNAVVARNNRKLHQRFTGR